MAIEETRKKIHFTPFDIRKGRQTDTNPAPTVTIVKGSYRMSKNLITELNLNKKFVRFFYDSIKNVIGFQVREEVELGALKGVGRWKMVHQNEKTGQWHVSMRKMLLSEFGEKVADASYYSLPVKKYIEPNGMDRGEIYYFVELVKEEEEESV